MVAAALLFGALKAGSTGMQATTTIPVDIIVVIQALDHRVRRRPGARVGDLAGQGARHRRQQFSAGWGT